jgi:hypothetical protein
MCVILSLLITLFLLLCITPNFGLALLASDEAIFVARIFIIMGVVMGVHLSLNTARRWSPFVNIAESIFAALGYVESAQVDLPEQDKIFRKNQTPGGEPRRYAPWVFRYLK